MNQLSPRRIISNFQEKLAYDFSCLMIDLPVQAAQTIRDFGLRVIPNSDLAEKGREEHIHVTIKYGLHLVDFTEVRDLLLDIPPFKATLGKTSLFHQDDYDVVKLDISSPVLHKLNKMVSKEFENIETHPKYVPHVTIAYVKKDCGHKYDGLDTFVGLEVLMDKALFSGRDNRETAFKLFKDD